MAQWMSPSRIVVFVGLVVLGLLIPVWIGRAPAPSVQTTRVRQAPLVIEVTTNGVVEPVREAEVRARLGGRVVEVVEAGARVHTGDVLVAIDASAAAAELESVRSERLVSLESLRAARSTLERARERFTTDKELFDAGGLSREAYTESERTLHEAQAKEKFLAEEVPVRVASLDLRAQELEEQKEAATVRANADGTVYRSDVKVGETVAFGTPMLWVTDLDKLRVRVNVDQVDLGKVRVGQGVDILSNAFPDRSWVGRITEVVPHIRLKENRAVAEALATVQPPVEGLVPGMNVDVDIIVSEVEDVVQVPAEAVFRDRGGQFVFVVVRGRVRRTPVETGLSNMAYMEIRAGAEAGADVVVGPVPGLQDGMRVEVLTADEQHS